MKDLREKIDVERSKGERVGERTKREDRERRGYDKK